MSNPNRAWCKDCNQVLELVEQEDMGQTLRCSACGITVEIGFGRPTVVIYRWTRTEVD